MIVHVSLNIYFYYQNFLFNNFMEQINILIDHIKVFRPLYKNSSKCTGCTWKSTYTDVSQSDVFFILSEFVVKITVTKKLPF